jgi:hypothetical protein
MPMIIFRSYFNHWSVNLIATIASIAVNYYEEERMMKSLKRSDFGLSKSRVL